MNTTTNETTVIRYMDIDRDYIYVRSCEQYSDDLNGWSFRICYELDEAQDFSDYEEDELTSMFVAFQEYYAERECELVKIRVTTEVEDLELMSSDILRETRQRYALSKLTERDIMALGITNIATYIKTKYT